MQRAAAARCGSATQSSASTSNWGRTADATGKNSPDVTRSRVRPAATIAIYASPLRAAAPAAEAITPALIEAAKKEGKLAFYTAMDLAFAQQLAKTFEERFTGISVRVERSGAERIFTRIDQEYSSNIHAVDVVNTADQAHCIVWKRNQWLAPYMPEEVAKHFGGEYYDPDGHSCDDAHSGLADRLQHQPCEEGRGAEEFRRPAGSEMGRQDRQGAPGLQRHHHECDVPDRARSRLGLLRKARQADASCRCSRRPTRPRRLR